LGTDGGLTYNPSTNAFDVVNGSVSADDYVEAPEHWFPDSTTPAHLWKFQATRSADLLHLNNSWATGNFPCILDGTTNASIITNNQLAGGNIPSTYAELDTPCVTLGNGSEFVNGTPTFKSETLYMTNTTNDYIIYGTQGFVAGTAASAAADVTFLVRGDNPMGRVFKVSVCLGVQATLTTAVNRTWQYDFTSLSLSITRNGSAFTKFHWTSPFSATISRTYTITATATTTFNIWDPLVNIDVFFEPDDSSLNDTYNIKLTYGQSVGSVPSTGGTFAVQSGNPAFAYMGFAPGNQTSTRTAGTGAFAFGQVQRVTPQDFAITKTLGINRTTIWLDNAHIDSGVNVVYYGSLVNGSTGLLPYCFASSFTNYKVYFQMNNVSSGANYQILSIQLVSSAGVIKTSGYLGRLSTLAGTYTGSVWNPASIPITYLTDSDDTVYEFDICSPNKLRQKNFTSTNPGMTAAATYVTMISTGIMLDTAAYNSMQWSVAAGTINGFVTILGYNSRI